MCSTRHGSDAGFALCASFFLGASGAVCTQRVKWAASKGRRVYAPKGHVQRSPEATWRGGCVDVEKSGGTPRRSNHAVPDHHDAVGVQAGVCVYDPPKISRPMRVATRASVPIRRSGRWRPREASTSDVSGGKHVSRMLNALGATRVRRTYCG